VPPDLRFFAVRPHPARGVSAFHLKYPTPMCGGHLRPRTGEWNNLV